MPENDPKMMTTRQALELAIRQQQAGRLDEAENIYRQILAQNPNHADALNLLGMIESRKGRYSKAVELLNRAITINPAAAVNHNNLGNVFKRQNQLPEAIEEYRRAVQLQPDYAEAHNNLANALKDQNQLPEAIAEYRRAVELKPDRAEVHKNLGLALREFGRLNEAIEAFRGAIRIQPDYAEAHNNLGSALQAQGRLDAAVACYKESLRLKPNYAEAHNNLGNAFKEQKQLPEAIAEYRRAIGCRPDLAAAYNNLGNALHLAGELDQAENAYHAAIALMEDNAEAHHNLGILLHAQGQFSTALDSYQKAVELKPDSAEAWNSLGNVFQALGRKQEAAGAFQEALRLKPDFAAAHNSLGEVLCGLGELDAGIAAYGEALRLKPDYQEAYNNLAGAFANQGLLDESLATLRIAMKLNPGTMYVHDNLIYNLHYHPDVDAKTIHEELGQWRKQYAEPLKKFIQPHANDPNSERQLRIGYVSPDFRDHSVAFFVENILAAHDPDQVEIFCYADLQHPDDTSARFRKLAHHWRDITWLKNERIAEMIRSDAIDILVDLAGHTGGNRLQLFARKPAPIQVTYLGYPDSTGLEAIDYRFTDAWADPPDQSEEFYTEELVRLPRTFLCYRPPETAPAAAPPAADEVVTFGCFNIVQKINIRVVRLWSEILQRLPGSRMLIKSLHLSDAGAQRHLRELFIACGIGPERLDLLGWSAAKSEHLQLYNHITVALDTFPYNGTTTTCEALWMGVPVVTLAGQHHMSRVGVSLLSNVGLPELIAETPQRYVQIAVELANDRPRLTELRRNLRARMQASPLTDAPSFARNMEVAYRQMWKKWCGKQM
jgi:protein O-GlcNAc transferase